MRNTTFGSRLRLMTWMAVIALTSAGITALSQTPAGAAGNASQGVNADGRSDQAGLTARSTPSPTPSPVEALPSSFEWSSTGQLLTPKPDADHQIVSVKDPTVVRYDDEWLVYFTVYSEAGGWNLGMTKFRDWADASSAPMHFLDTSAIGPGYRAAPNLFYFAPQKLWYLVYQTGLPSYSTSTNPADPNSWSAPRNFTESMPTVVQENIGNGYWLDYYVACDDTDCHLFSSDDNGHVYRAQTSLQNFPNGWGETVIALSDTRGTGIFEGSAHYKVQGSDQYLTLIEAWDAQGRRYYRAWTSTSLAGPYTSLGSVDYPFAHIDTVSWPEGQWSRDISHGELVRAGFDQNMEISPCNLQFLYQGLSPDASGDYNLLPYRLGLLTQTNSTC
jgi:endo-1,4-beta-xylanase